MQSILLSFTGRSNPQRVLALLENMYFPQKLIRHGLKLIKQFMFYVLHYNANVNCRPSQQAAQVQRTRKSTPSAVSPLLRSAPTPRQVPFWSHTMVGEGRWDKITCFSKKQVASSCSRSAMLGSPWPPPQIMVGL